jgi:hypothetical protein
MAVDKDTIVVNTNPRSKKGAIDEKAAQGKVNQTLSPQLISSTNGKAETQGIKRRDPSEHRQPIQEKTERRPKPGRC